ncbi:wsv264 [White spot syndrome virus]|uniref:Wsv264 n=4 Tax=White spot syndrome virus TaxID=342409 RepID=Q8VAW1_WSSVS|nr:wsv264 [Shrimp white spot syndrome virus]AFX59638.1 wsv264 [White spot syndrome virus]AAL33267.1 wsv264 [Shrimp white spot syndrome virus]AAL89187.1 WSSV319 [Shrimp white spot syndrome virus]AWQ60841.1 wsv264 [Shrimp white spot syndrome virus]AWQ61259.1 wsv264 [Shrimp white spot syndrome virus]
MLLTRSFPSNADLTFETHPSQKVEGDSSVRPEFITLLNSTDFCAFLFFSNSSSSSSSFSRNSATDLARTLTSR